MQSRCAWAQSEPNLTYHDTEWGVPLHDDRALFELLTLEGAQAGLSWTTVLRKRDAYRSAFDNFDPYIVAGYDEQKIKELLDNPGIVRNKLKVQSTVTNAAAFLAVQREFGSFDEFIWKLIGGTTIRNHWRDTSQLPARTDLSDRVSKTLLKRGFRFVGSTICYAFLQASGMVNDHIVTCFRYEEEERPG